MVQFTINKSSCVIIFAMFQSDSAVFDVIPMAITLFVHGVTLLRPSCQTHWW